MPDDLDDWPPPDEEPREDYFARRKFHKARDLWLGLLGLIGGALLLVGSAALLLFQHRLTAWGFGLGVGFALIGAHRLITFVDDYTASR
jgi:hypothetical protein